MKRSIPLKFIRRGQCFVTIGSGGMLHCVQHDKCKGENGKLYQIAHGLMKRFPEGNEPFQMVTCLAEECGELAAQVNHFEASGVKRQKMGEPDTMKLAVEGFID